MMILNDTTTQADDEDEEGKESEEGEEGKDDEDDEDDDDEDDDDDDDDDDNDDEDDEEDDCFFNTFKSQWQPHLPLFVCDADASGLRPCKSGKIPNMIQII